MQEQSGRSCYVVDSTDLTNVSIAGSEAMRETAGSVLLGRDVGPCPFLRGKAANGVTVISAVGEQDCIGLEGVEHGDGGHAVVACPAVHEIDRPPSASTSAWIFVVSPRERPMQPSSAPPNMRHTVSMVVVTA